MLIHAEPINEQVARPMSLLSERCVDSHVPAIIYVVCNAQSRRAMLFRSRAFR